MAPSITPLWELTVVPAEWPFWTVQDAWTAVSRRKSNDPVVERGLKTAQEALLSRLEELWASHPQEARRWLAQHLGAAISLLDMDAGAAAFQSAGLALPQPAQQEPLLGRGARSRAVAPGRRAGRSAASSSKPWPWQRRPRCSKPANSNPLERRCSSAGTSCNRCDRRTASCVSAASSSRCRGPRAWQLCQALQTCKQCWSRKPFTRTGASSSSSKRIATWVRFRTSWKRRVCTGSAAISCSEDLWRQKGGHSTPRWSLPSSCFAAPW